MTVYKISGTSETLYDVSEGINTWAYRGFHVGGGASAIKPGVLQRFSQMPRTEHPIITGIGSRSTPVDVLEDMKRIGQRCKELGFYIRSGHAEGADWAFEQGAQENTLVFLPWEKFNAHLKSAATTRVLEGEIPPEVSEIVDALHPNPKALTSGARRLHSRNVYQVLGRGLGSPSRALVCWTPNGRAVGGSATAINLAHACGIPVFNLYRDTIEEVLSWIEWDHILRA